MVAIDGLYHFPLLGVEDIEWCQIRIDFLLEVVDTGIGSLLPGFKILWQLSIIISKAVHVGVGG